MGDLLAVWIHSKTATHILATVNRFIDAQLYTLIIAMASPAVLVFLASLFISSSALRFKDCGSMHGKVRSVTVAGCDNTPTCILKSGTDVSLTVGFTSCKFADILLGLF